MIMAIHFLQNGNFSEDLAHWQVPEGFAPHFKPFNPPTGGQSIKVPVGTTISQAIPRLPNQTLHIEFDVHSADLDRSEALFLVLVCGYDAKHELHISPIVGAATQEWVHLSGNIFFPVALKDCSLKISSPAPPQFPSGSSSKRASPYAPVRFANFSLTVDKTA
jgi:hypothetical protein